MSFEGRLIDGKYVIVRRIAEGGTSTVWLGVNERIGKDVAVKVLRPDAIARDADILERFEREARHVSRIRSAHVADVYDCGELPTGERFMVMEYVDGESLASILERERVVPTETLRAIALQILDALAAAHRVGVIHRDLKPENVIVSSRGDELVVKVVDFGISMLKGDDRELRLTAFGSVLGTPLYMSPEQARGQTTLVDQRTDLYSLGVMLYEATAGEPPLTGENVNELLFRVALDEPEPLTSRVPWVDPALAVIVEKAMSKDAVFRYQTAAEMRAAIETWRAPEPKRSKIKTAKSRLQRAWRLALVAPLLVLPSIGGALAAPTSPPAPEVRSDQKEPRSKKPAVSCEAVGMSCTLPVDFDARGASTK
jgi:serine/threonine protein kinase